MSGASPAIPALLAGTAAALGTAGLVLGAEWARARRHRNTVLRQLRQLADERGAVVSSSSAEPLLRDALESSWLKMLSARIPQLRGFGPLLQQAGLAWNEQRFLVSMGVGALFGGLIGWAIGGAGVALMAGVAIGAFIPYGYVRRVRTRRLRSFEEQLPEAIDLLGRAIRSGHPLSAGLRMVAEESGQPVGGEFRRVFEEQKFGLPFEDSLTGLAARVPLVDVRILVTAVMIQRDVGGNLAEILDNLSHLIRSRFTIRRQLRTYTAQGRMSGYVLGILPIAVGFMIFALNPEYIMTLFKEPIGRAMMWSAAALQFLGFLWIRRIVDIEI
ncbi:MAG TPA: type II secretion system F family protein [Longimicrobium sp.]